MYNRQIKFADLFNADVQADDLAKFLLEQFIIVQSDVLADEDEENLIDVSEAVDYIKAQKDNAKEFIKELFNDISSYVVKEVDKLEVVPSEISLAENGKMYAFRAKVNDPNSMS